MLNSDLFFWQILHLTTELRAVEVVLRMQGSSSLWTVTSWHPILICLISRGSGCLSRAHLNPLSSLAWSNFCLKLDWWECLTPWETHVSLSSSLQIKAPAAAEIMCTSPGWPFPRTGRKFVLCSSESFAFWAKVASKKGNWIQFLDAHDKSQHQQEHEMTIAFLTGHYSGILSLTVWTAGKRLPSIITPVCFTLWPRE